MYHICSSIRRGFPLSRMSPNNQISPVQFGVIQVLPFLSNLNDLDPSFKMDLDFWDCFERKKMLSYERIQYASKCYYTYSYTFL